VSVAPADLGIDEREDHPRPFLKVDQSYPIRDSHGDRRVRRVHHSRVAV
jgi:hypothetical protein